MRTRILTFISAAVALVCITVIADRVLMPYVTSHHDEIVIPDLTSQPVDAADAKLKVMGLSATTKQRYSKTKPPGFVLQHLPEAGTMVKNGRAVELIVSTDAVLVTVPSVLLTTYRDARFTLESIGLAVGTIDTIASNEYPQGIVTAQSVEPGSRINVGLPVNLVVSRGHDLLEARVPYLIKQSLVEAKALIADAGLRLGKVNKRYAADLLPGTVMEQSIDSSKSVPPLTPVDLVISSADQDDE